MSELIGYVNKIDIRSGTSKTGKPYTAYTVLVTLKDGTQKFVGWGFNLPPFPANVWIKTTVEQNGEYLNYKGAPIEQAPGAAPAVTQAAPAPGARQAGRGGAAAKDTYWKEKESYDKEEREPRIQYQAARRDAIELVGYLISADALPVSEAKSKGAKAERYDQVLDFVNKLTVQLYHDTRTLRVVDQVQDAEQPLLASDDIPEVIEESDDNIFTTDSSGSPFA